MGNFSPIQHPVIKVFGDTEMAAIAVSTGTATSEWFDVSAWADKKVAWEVDSGGAIDVDIDIHTSSQGAYELNNKTATTDDYVAINVVTAHTDALYTVKDSSDIDDFQRTHRSWRVVVGNDSAAAITGGAVWIEGSA